MPLPCRRASAAIALLGVLASLAGCARRPDRGENDAAVLDAARDGAWSEFDARPQARCTVDADGDGYGPDCSRGPDCDDADPGVTDQCYRCASPAANCPCTREGERRVCDATTDSDLPGPSGSCHLGQRFCKDGAWTRCASFTVLRQTVVTPSSCNASCNPACQTAGDCPDTAADLSGGSDVVLAGSTSSFCPGGPPGGVALPPTIGTGTGGDGGVGGDGGGLTCGSSSLCNGACCGGTQACVTIASTGGRSSTCGAATGSGVSSSTQLCGLTCAAGTIHCGLPPLDQCCPAGSVCHQAGCTINNPAGCRNSTDCPLAGQVCLFYGTCTTGTATAGTCLGTRSPNNGCFASARAQGFQEIDDIFNTNDGQDARTLRFGRYIRGLERSPTSNGPCTAGVDCPFGRHSAAAATSTYPCPLCSPTNASVFASFTGAKTPETVARFTDTLDWRWIDFVRFDASGARDTNGNAEVPWNGAIFDLGMQANQVVLFPARDDGDDCQSSGMQFQVWLTDNPGATEINTSSTPDPTKWNVANFVRMYTEGWTRNPRATAAATDTSNLRDATTYGNAVADGWATVWALPSACHAFRFASVSPGNMNQPGNSCDTGRSANKIDAVAGLDADGNVPSIFHVLPYGASAGPDALVAKASAPAVDVYLLADTTSSMSQELAALRASLTGSDGVTGCSFATGGLVGAARCLGGDVRFGAGAVEDFPVAPYGAAGDQVYRHVFDMGNDATGLLTALNGLSVHGGADAPDGQTAALWSAITGNGFAFGTSPLTARSGCASGRFGYPCFRDGALPVVLLYTDSAFHNGPSGANAYLDTTLGTGAATPSFATTVAALTTAGARVAVINSCGTTGCPSDATTSAQSLASQTGSYASGTTPADYPIAADGTNLGTTSVTALTNLLANGRMSVTAVALDNPATTSVDERCFVRNPAGTASGTLRLSSGAGTEAAPFASGACTGTTSAGGVGYAATGCQRGAAVNFAAEFANNCVRSTGANQTFTFDVVYYGNGIYELGRVKVTVLVPRVSYPPSGTFNATVNGSGVCAVGKQVNWTRVLSDADVPPGTSVRLEVRTANTQAGLASAAWVTLGTITSSPAPALPLGATVAQSLLAAAQSGNLPFLELRYTLNSDSTLSYTPALLAYRVEFDCLDAL